MNRLKVFGAVGGAVALIVIWPLAVGKIGQDAITKVVENANGKAVSAKIVSYDRGYLTSVVKTKFTVEDPGLVDQLKADDMPTSFTVTSDISHGLYSLTAHSTVDNNDKLPLTMDSTTLLNGSTDYRVDLGNWHFSSKDTKDPFSVTAAPSYLSGSVTVSGKATYKLNIPSIEMDFASKEKMLISDLTGEGQGKREKGFWLGNQTIKLKKVNIDDAKGTSTFSLDGAQYKFNSNLDDKNTRIDSHNVLSVDNIQTSDGGKVSDLVFDATIGDIDRQSFEELMSLYQKDQTLSQDDLKKVVPYINTLFEKGLYLSIDKFAMHVGKGQFDSDWKFVIPEGTKGVVQNPMVILTALKGHINSFFSNELVTEYPFIKHSVDSALASKMVEKKDKGYELKTKIEDGNLVFEGGQKVPLIALLMSGMAHKQ
ncbi:YdgA family protein [Vibrio sp. S4M6]|uniref:DUF945 family protein n=1 Tax=Vibrio sinus TaxID=2946865 RepID=UPI00202ABBEB|nr:DUF945 family protein [Vibrio sinus]MCL9782748.1 YdgA family protein [Vibrio sinus]